MTLATDRVLLVDLMRSTCIGSRLHFPSLRNELFVSLVDAGVSIVGKHTCSSVATMTLATDRVLLVVLMHST